MDIRTINGFAGRPPDVVLNFGHDPGAPSTARRAIAPLLSDPADCIADAVRLVTSELVSNVILHTSNGGTLLAWDPHPDVPLRLEVIDDEPRLPAAVAQPDITGRGLHIVDELADSWGIFERAGTKVVWAEFDRSIH